MRAYKCDRCGDYQDEELENINHRESDMDSGWRKGLCQNCYHGLIEYLIGASAEEVNGWDAFSIEEAEENGEI